MIYGYARVSTINQRNYGNSLEEQTNQLKEAGAERIFTDSFTGTKVDRPEFQELLHELRSGDTLIVTKLDRFARSVSNPCGGRALNTRGGVAAYQRLSNSECHVGKVQQSDCTR